MSGENVGHLILQPRLITVSFLKDSKRKVFTEMTTWGGAQFSMKVSEENPPLACNEGTTCSCKKKA